MRIVCSQLTELELTFIDLFVFCIVLPAIFMEGAYNLQGPESCSTPCEVQQQTSKNISINQHAATTLRI